MATAQHHSIHPPNRPATLGSMLGNANRKNAQEKGSSKGVGDGSLRLADVPERLAGLGGFESAVIFPPHAARIIPVIHFRRALFSSPAPRTDRS